MWQRLKIPPPIRVTMCTYSPSFTYVCVYIQTHIHTHKQSFPWLSPGIMEMHELLLWMRVVYMGGGGGPWRPNRSPRRCRDFSCLEIKDLPLVVRVGTLHLITVWKTQRFSLWRCLESRAGTQQQVFSLGKQKINEFIAVVEHKNISKHPIRKLLPSLGKQNICRCAPPPPLKKE